MIRALPLLLALTFAGCNKSGSGDPAPQQVTPTATVQTAKLVRGPIAATITSYGTVVAQSGVLESISVQYESKVVRLLVSAGEQVAKDRQLIEIMPSPDARLALMQAKTAAESSRMQLEGTKNRYALKLAVNQELQLAEQTARDAAARLASLELRGADERATLKADLPGIVATIDVRMGQIVAAGGPLLSIVPDKQIEVRLGVEPEDAGRLITGGKVRLVAVNQDGVETTGKIRLVTRRINPQTRLTDIFVTVPPEVPLLLDGYVRSEIEVDKKNALIVPRDAVLPGAGAGAGGSILFTVRDGHAVKHQVTTGLETDKSTEVSGDTIQAGDEVVTVGNYQLEDGMAVTIAKSAP